MEYSLFEVNEDGTVTYSNVPTVSPVISITPEVTVSPSPTESEDLNDRVILTPTPTIGDILQDPESVPEVTPEVTQDPPEMDSFDSFDGNIAVVLSEEVTSAILGLNPAGGSLGPSTLDYFDRIVSGLNRDYKYIAYRTDSSDSYDGVLYFGKDYRVTGNTITFGDEAVQIKVDRVNTSNYNNETHYYESDASNTSVSFSQGGTVIYYTNVKEGYPVLGGFQGADIGFAPFVVGALITAAATVILTKLFRK